MRHEQESQMSVFIHKVTHSFYTSSDEWSLVLMVWRNGLEEGP